MSIFVIATIVYNLLFYKCFAKTGALRTNLKQKSLQTQTINQTEVEWKFSNNNCKCALRVHFEENIFVS